MVRPKGFGEGGEARSKREDRGRVGEREKGGDGEEDTRKGREGRDGKVDGDVGYPFGFTAGKGMDSSFCGWHRCDGKGGGLCSIARRIQKRVSIATSVGQCSVSSMESVAMKPIGGALITESGEEGVGASDVHRLGHHLG